MADKKSGWVSISLLLCVALLTAFFRYPAAVKSIVVVFRYDDYSSSSPTAIEKNIIAEFRHVGRSITFGVIPFVVERDAGDPSPQNLLVLNQDKVALLKSAADEGVVDVALHGYSHQTRNVNDVSEFRGLEPGAQQNRISSGKRFLEAAIGVPINTFIPPWNAYDLSTLDAAATLGFSILSADTVGPAMPSSRLKFLPATCGLKRLQEAIGQARYSGESQPVIVVLFHAYDFKEVDAHGSMAIGELSEVLNQLVSQRDIQVMSIQQASKVIDNLSPSRYLLNQKIDAISKLVPIRFVLSHSRLYSSSTAILREFQFRIAIFYLAFLAILFLVIQHIRHRAGRSSNTCQGQ